MREERDVKGLVLVLVFVSAAAAAVVVVVVVGLALPFSPEVPAPANSSREVSPVLRMRWTRSRASRNSASVCWSKASRFERTVPENRTGSCGMMARRLRRSCSFILDMSKPSMWMEPERASRKRKRARVREDLPAPVRPTTPILWLGATLKERPLSTGGRSGAYPTTRLLTSRRPSIGQAAGALAPDWSSVGMRVYSMMRSVAFMSSSVFEYVRIIDTIASVYWRAKPRAKPAKEASMSFVDTMTTATRMAKMAPTRLSRKPIQRLNNHRCQ